MRNSLILIILFFNFRFANEWGLLLGGRAFKLRSWRWRRWASWEGLNGAARWRRRRRRGSGEVEEVEEDEDQEVLLGGEALGGGEGWGGGGDRDVDMWRDRGD